MNSTDVFTAKYAGAFQYDANNALKRVATSVGQAIITPDSLRFEYYLTDHLGNVRIVFNEKGDVVQNTEYYPFGLAIAKDGKTVAERNSINRFLYNEKELQVGSGYLDYGARMYMPEVGRWGSVDPLGELSRRFSPYVYGYDNPLRFIDPDGRLADDPQKGVLQRIIDFLGLFKKPESQEEAATYANRQARFSNTANALAKGSEDLKSKAEWVPFLGGITDISQGAVRKNKPQVILGMASLVGDALPGEGRGGKYVVENIEGFYVRGSTSISNATCSKTIQALASLREGTSISRLVKTFENEAKAQGANKLIIKGIDIIETRLFNAEAARRLGYLFRHTSDNSIELTKILK